jgi:hypothetical protein
MSEGPPEDGAEQPQPQGSGGVAPPAIPLDADATQSMHFRRLLRHPVTLSLGITLIIAAFVGGTVGAGPAVGGGGALAVFLLVLLIVYVLASNAAKEDFFSSYASGRGLTRQSGRGHLPPTTPLLRKGDNRYAEEIMDGTLPGGLPGAIALYTYEDKTRDAEGNEDTTYYKFTVVMHDLPAVAQQVSDVYCQRRSGFRFMDSAEDAFRRMKRLELESDALDKRYEIFYGANDDEVWMKQLFSPKFIVWLTEQPPKDFAFELSAGSLCVNVKKHYDNAADLDGLCEAASEVARRLAVESSETSSKTTT